MTTTTVPDTQTKTGEGTKTATGQEGTAGGEKQTAEGKNPPASKTPASEAPQRYELAAPKGHSTSAGVLKAFSAAAFDAGLTEEVAQKLLAKVVPDLAAVHTEQIKSEREAWAKAIKLDKELGGDKADEVAGQSKKVVTTFGDAELQQLLEESGLGDHPAFRRFTFKISKGISEDKIENGGTTTGDETLAKRLFPTFK